MNASNRFAKIRIEIRQQRGNACEECGTTNNLHVHHIRYPEDGEYERPEDLLVLCRTCHGAKHQKHNELKIIAVDPDTFDVIRRLAYERRVSNGRVVADAINLYTSPLGTEQRQRDYDAATDPRSAAERAQDEHAAQVRDTQESDRP
jgi:hypothetical protein